MKLGRDAFHGSGLVVREDAKPGESFIEGIPLAPETALPDDKILFSLPMLTEVVDAKWGERNITQPVGEGGKVLVWLEPVGCMVEAKWFVNGASRFVFSSLQVTEVRVGMDGSDVVWHVDADCGPVIATWVLRVGRTATVEETHTPIAWPSTTVLPRPKEEIHEFTRADMFGGSLPERLMPWKPTILPDDQTLAGLPISIDTSEPGIRTIVHPARDGSQLHIRLDPVRGTADVAWIVAAARALSYSLLYVSKVEVEMDGSDVVWTITSDLGPIISPLILRVGDTVTVDEVHTGVFRPGYDGVRMPEM